MFTELASRGVDCYIVEMPFNLAFLGSDKADSIIDSTNYTHYFLSGHSLGGVMASSYVSNNDKCDGLILLASYPSKEVDEPVLSIYGSNDGVLNLESYQKAKPLMKNLTEVIIDGGNHVQFGYYGHQSGDNNADITSQDQQNQTVDEILDFINQIS